MLFRSHDLFRGLLILELVAVEVFHQRQVAQGAAADGTKGAVLSGGLEGTGAPDLTDADWLYGGDPVTIRQTLLNGRQGVMPAWQGRLSDAEIRMLALYVEGFSIDGVGDAP